MLAFCIDVMKILQVVKSHSNILLKLFTEATL